jgi:multidrug transporter EmrE-like cation transporter
MVAVLGWFGLIKLNGNVGRSTVIWCVGGIAVALLIGSVVFGERLTLYNKIGVGLCLIGVVLTSI